MFIYGGAVMGTLSARRQAELDAEGERAGREHEMDRYLTGWAGDKQKVRSVLGLIALVLLSPYGVIAVIAALFQPGLSGAGALAIAAAIIGVPVLLWRYPPRATRGRLFLYEDGIVAVLNREQRAVVLRYADLATMSLDVRQGYDAEYLASCVLTDQAGRELKVRNDLFGARACEEVVSSAGHAIASRLAGPLIRRLDEDLSVTIGGVTVDSAGITVLSGRTWTVPWERARAVRFRLWGQRLSVDTGQRPGKSVELDGQPNSFLIRPVIEHAARRAGVVVSAD